MRGISRAALLAGLAAALAACGSQPYNPPEGPFAVPPQNAPAAVASRGCGPGSTPTAVDARFLHVSVIRQGTDLQRVADDLSGAVPGGNLHTDASLAARDAQDLRTAIRSANLCPAVAETLVFKAALLAGADGDLLAAVDSHGDVGAALAKSQAAYRDVKAAVGAP